MISTAHFRLADPREAADLGAFLGRLLRFDRAAAVRLQAHRSAAGGVLAVFGRLPLGSTGVLAVRTARLAASAEPGAAELGTAEFGAAGPGAAVAGTAEAGTGAERTGEPAPGEQALREAADVTVSAGQLLEGIDEQRGDLAVPPPVTGPAWAGLLPPRGGWQPLVPGAAGAFSADLVLPQLIEAVAEFKERTTQVPEHHRSREVLDAIADEIWSRPLAALPELPMRAVHAAYRIGFLQPGAPLTAHRAGSWLRLSSPLGTVVLRAAPAPGAGLGLSPLG